MIEIIIIIATLSIVIPSIYSFWIGAPILYSPQKAIREALRTLPLKKNTRFVDLGMGNGRTLAVAAKEFGLTVHGFELAPFVFLLAKINLWRRGISTAKTSMENFYHASLCQYDIVFCFLTPKAMDRLRPKFENELKSGAFVISYAFPISRWIEKEILTSCHPGNVYIYEIGKTSANVRQ